MVTIKPISQLPSDEKGFTMLELLIVVTLIGLLATIAMPIYHNSIIKAKEAALKENLYVMRESIDKYYADIGSYPPTIIALVEKKYLRTVPVDPLTGSKDTWITVNADTGNGIFDVKSGSERTGTNDIPYSEW